MNVNKVILIGRVGKDPEVRRLENGNSVASFSLATNDNYKDKQGNKVEQVDWHNIVIWGKLCEVAEKYVKKGDPIYVEGKLKTRSWEKDGITRYATEILVNNMTMLGGKPSGQSQQQPASQPQQQEQTEGWDPYATDDLPF